MTNNDEQAEHARGGYIPGEIVSLKARRVGNRWEYWEPMFGGAWVPVIYPSDPEWPHLPRARDAR